eukprot:m.1641196 g.1641196  ORF g.1641196 m.1641196 type:complete len:735 (-) comp46175_c0_seq1:88-2292(-)
MGHVISKIVHVVERIVFPPLLIEDALEDHYKSELHSIQSSSQTIEASGKSTMNKSIATIKDLQKQEFKARFLISVVSTAGALKSELKAPDLTKFSTKGYEIATTAVNIVQQVVTFIAMFLPEPIGIIVGLAAPLIGDVINETIEVVELSKAVDNARKNQGKLVATLAANNTVLEKTIAQIQDTMKQINDLQAQIFSLLKVSSWEDIFTSDKMTANFVQDLGDLDKITTKAEAEALVGKLPLANEKTLLMQIWESKAQVEDSINKINHPATKSNAVRAAALAFLSSANDTCNMDHPMLDEDAKDPILDQLMLPLRAAGAMRAKAVSLAYIMAHLASRALGNTFSIDVYDSNKLASSMTKLEVQAADNASNTSLQSAAKVISLLSTCELAKFDSFPISMVKSSSPFRAEFTKIIRNSKSIKDRDAGLLALGQKMAQDSSLQKYIGAADVHAIDVTNGTLSQLTATAQSLACEVARNFSVVDNAAKVASSGKDEVASNTLRQYELAANGLLAVKDTSAAQKLVQSFNTKNQSVIMKLFSTRQKFMSTLAPLGITIPVPGSDILSKTWCRFSTAFSVPGTSLYLSPPETGSSGLVLSHTPHFWTFYKLLGVEHGYRMFHEPPANQPIVFTDSGSLSPTAMVAPAGSTEKDAASLQMIIVPVPGKENTYYLEEASSKQFLTAAAADGTKIPAVGLSHTATTGWCAVAAGQLTNPTPAQRTSIVHHLVTATGQVTINHFN